MPAKGQNLAVEAMETMITENLSNTGALHVLLFQNNINLYEQNFPYQNQRLNADLRIKISTASMWLANATILSVIDKNLLQLTTPVGEVLPNFKGEKGKITLLQLLTHTSGMPINSIYLKNKNLTLQQSVDSIALKVEPSYKAGEFFQFGGVSIQIAARMAEVVSGKSWEQLFYENIAAPCLMQISDFGKAKSVSIGDGAYSSAKDYSNFLRMLLNKGVFNGNRVLSESSIQKMFTDYTQKIPLKSETLLGKIQTSRSYGLGVWIDKVDAESGVATELSCVGTRGFSPWINTCRNFAGVVTAYGDLQSILYSVEIIKKNIESRWDNRCNEVSIESTEAMGAESTFSFQQKTLTIHFHLENKTLVSLKIFDSLGNEIKELLNEEKSTGPHSVLFSTHDLVPGIYFYRLKAGHRLETKKMMLTSP